MRGVRDAKGSGGANSAAQRPSARLPKLHTGHGRAESQGPHLTDPTAGNGPGAPDAAPSGASDGQHTGHRDGAAAALRNTAGEREIQREDFSGEALAALRHEFEMRGGLDEGQFVETLHAVLGGHIAEHELLRLFMVRATDWRGCGPKPSPAHCAAPVR